MQIPDSFRSILSLVFWMAVLICLPGCGMLAGVNTPPAEAGEVLFKDDFTNPQSGWDQVTTEQGATSYENGTYRIWVNPPRTNIWANPHLKFSNVRVETSAIRMGGSDNNSFGILCRYQDRRNFYEFVISSDGYYGILKVKDGQQTPLGMEALLPSEKIRQGQKTNHLRVDCVDDLLTLYVNGEQLAQARDAEFKTGDVGLVAASFDSPGTDIRFAHFVVIQP